MRRTVKLFRPSRLLGTMASADFSQFVVTTDRAPSVRPHGISPEPFPVYSPDLRIEVTVAFWTLMPVAISSAQYALISGFCPSSHGFAIASSRLYLTVQTLQVALRFVGNYAPRDFHPRFGACPSYNKQGLQRFAATLILCLYWACCLRFLIENFAIGYCVNGLALAAVVNDNYIVSGSYLLIVFNKVVRLIAVIL